MCPKGQNIHLGKRTRRQTGVLPYGNAQTKSQVFAAEGKCSDFTQMLEETRKNGHETMHAKYAAAQPFVQQQLLLKEGLDQNLGFGSGFI